MDRGLKFWLLISLFQVAFGLLVFGLTRQYYLQDTGEVSSQPSVSHTTGTGTTPANPTSELEQLLDLYPAQSNPADPQQVLIQADEDFAQGRYESAAKGYTQLVHSNQASVDIYNNLGITLHYLGRSDEALGVLDQGIATDPLYQRIWLTQGYVNSQIGNLDQAKAAFNMAISLDADTEVGRAASQMLEQIPN